MKRVPLAEACLVTMGQAPAGASYNTSGEGVPLLAGAGDFGDCFPRTSKFTTEPTRVTSEGDLILCVRATIGDLNWSDKPYCLGRGVAGIRPRDDVADSNYLWHCLTAHRNELEQKANGSTFRQVKRSDIEELEIPLPPLEEQRRIAAILDKADAIRRNRQQALQLADQFLQSLFLDMFGDPVTNPKGWPEARLAELGTVTTGNTPSRKRPEYYGDTIEWIKSDNINTPYHFLTPANEGLSESGRQVARIAHTGATLVTCIAGSPSCIGNAALADRDVAFNQQINAIEPISTTNSFFLYSLVCCLRKSIQKASTNSMKGMVNKSAFSSVLAFRPPNDMQKSFGTCFQEYLDLNSNSLRADRQCEELFGSIVQRAFRGDL